MTNFLKPETDDVKALLEQARLTQTCALFAVAIATAVLITNFGPEPQALADARKSAKSHRESVAMHEQLLRDTESALRQTEEALARVRSRPAAAP